MPWKQSGPMDERIRFIAAYQDGLWPMSELCRRFGVSRRVGYKILHRYEREGLEGLKDRSRAPAHSPQRITSEVETVLLDARQAHPTWGPRKILAWLIRKQPVLGDRLPAASTVGDLYRRHGLVESRRRRAAAPGHTPASPLRSEGPNEVWTADFKGEFRLGSGRYCYPFTLADAHSRYLLSCHAQEAITVRETRAALQEAFRSYGLPEAIRTDNGRPFVGIGRTGLSQLGVWWIQLGIRHQRIPRGRPDQNGRHERMHRTLKAEATCPPEVSIEAQQRRFDDFCHDFNQERPHEALGQQTPASCFRSSERAYPEQIEPPAYPGHYEPRLVSGAGMIRFQRHTFFVATPLAGEVLGLVEVEDGIWSIQYYDRELGRISTKQREPSINLLPLSPV
jgi:putative transposase